MRAVDGGHTAAAADGGGGFIGIRTLPPTSLSRCSSAAAAVSQDDATCASPKWLGRSLSCVCIKRKGTYERIYANLTPLQEGRLQRLKQRMKVYFDPSRRDHQVQVQYELEDLVRKRCSMKESEEALKALWVATYPDQELHSLISDQWKEMGWQGRDPSTDFSLFKHFPCWIGEQDSFRWKTCFFFAKVFSTSFKKLLNKEGGQRATWEYPFAVAGVNITFMIMQMLDLQSSKPKMFVRSVFIQMLAEDEWAFDLLYCVAFMIMDKQWLERNASYMEFNEVLRSTRSQLERELLLDDVARIEDMPSYNLLS